MGGLCPKEDQTDEAESKQSAGNVAPSEQSSGNNNSGSNAASGGGSEAKQDDTAPDEQKEDAASGGGSSKVVVRREIRDLSESEVKRFFDAVDKMMENKSGPGTSEFFRCASYHGQPAPIYCQHGRETFPGWHRVYLMDFEKALQQADRDLGNDGNVALHYWDWTVNQQDGLPKMIRDRFTGWPDDFWPESLRNERMTQELRRASDREIASQLRSWNVSSDASDCLLATQHWAHASTRFRNNAYPSLETPHNSIHVIVGGGGGQMGGVAWAAFDIAFWLHHCNVDRIYESYLEIEPDSREEFENFQDSQNVDMFEAQFEPFEKTDGSKYTAKDTFNTNNLGYRYDTLFKPPPQQLREAPTFVLFSQVKVYEFESKCYQIHCYIIDGDKEDEFKEPVTSDDIDYDSPNYAGGAGIFGRGMECQNCVNRPPQDIVIDITRTLRELSINRYKAKAKIYILETTEVSNQLQELSETPLPEPIITGPLFANKSGDELLDQDDKATNNTLEVEALQRYLQKFGYYAPEKKIDGDYGDYTRQAVSDYQKATGNLKIDGIAGPKTRESIVTNKRCANIDPFAKNDVVDDKCNFKQCKYGSSKEIKYFIAVQPGYLKRDKVELAIKTACDEYDNVSSLKFTKVDEEKESDIKFSWVMFNREDDLLRFDGPGGVLGRGGIGYVEFDIAERWVIGLNNDDEQISDLSDPNTWYRGQPTISLYYTALHELGHALGLVHSVDPNDVMSPWYNPKQMKLSKNDIDNLKKIVDQ
eukprot:CAMPEP_0201566396 /NCGR_PEP_ID=MMETSP0190_2-20130828/6141_1 /ASSEMBLY_ACC=CAM_ASM_000263 /TAXON_ID=37353 /ORGANISM="Rosalina sp." /LENGTH=758 /DNA_ID=CAMNT_0047985047 /DNA_START=92 /DNA_END=2368 /DNA_ORIENTATION=+